MTLTLVSPQIASLIDLSTCVPLSVDDFSSSVVEEYIDYPLETQKMVTAEKAINEFETAVTRTKEMIDSFEGEISPEVETAFQKARESFNLALSNFNSGVARYERRMSLYMKCSPLTRGILSPREGKQWDPWADDATSPRREEFAEMSCVIVVMAVFGSFFMGYMLSLYKIGMPDSSRLMQSGSTFRKSLNTKNLKYMSSIPFLRDGNLRARSMPGRPNATFETIGGEGVPSSVMRLVRQLKTATECVSSPQRAGFVKVDSYLRDGLMKIHDWKATIVSRYQSLNSSTKGRKSYSHTEETCPILGFDFAFAERHVVSR